MKTARVGALLATGGYDNTVRLWDAQAGTTVHVLKVQDRQVNRVAVSPDKREVLVAAGTSVRLYTTTSSEGEPMRSFEGHTGNITELAYSRSGRWFFSASEDGSLRVWDPREGGCQRTYENRSSLRASGDSATAHARVGHGSRVPIHCAALHPDQAAIVTGDDRGTVRVWDLTADRCVLELVRVFFVFVLLLLLQRPSRRSVFRACAQRPEKGSPVSAVSVSPDAKTLVAGTHSGWVYTWRAPTAVAPGVGAEEADAAAAAGGGGGGVAAATEELPLARASRHSERSEEGEGGGGGEGEGGDKELSGSYRYVPHTRVAAHARFVLRVAITPDSRHLATCSADGLAKMWTLPDLSPVTTFAGHTRWVWDCVFSADGSFLVTASSDGTAKLWETVTGDIARTYAGHARAITAVALHDSPDDEERRPVEDLDDDDDFSNSGSLQD
jgi:G protein beta subunit-like protein